MDNNSRRQGSTDALPIGYSLHWYELLEVIGRGGYGLTYLAMDRNLQRKVAIKEYLPLDFACRDSTYTVHPITKNHKELFDWGLERFLVEARTLAKFNHPAIIRVVSVFEHNKTAYMIMEYEEGDDLAIAYMEKAPFNEEQLLDLFLPIIEGLALVHEAGFIHRDIKPSNVYLRHDGSPVLLDFGSARQTIGSRTRALTSLVTAGYAPFEQYNESEDAQGAWTDIYGLGATLYFCMTGNKPADAMERGSALLKNKRDIYQPLSHMAGLPYSEAFKLAIDHALMFHAEDRPQHALEWAQMLTGQIELAPLPISEEVEASTPAAKEITRPPVTARTTYVTANATANSTGNARQKGKVTGPSPASRQLTPEAARIIEQAIDSDADDDSTRIYHRPASPAQTQAETQLRSQRADEPTGKRAQGSITQSIQEPMGDNTVVAALPQTRMKEPTILAQPAVKPRPAPQPRQPAAQPAAKENIFAQWQDKLRVLTDALVNYTKSQLGTLKGLDKTRKTAVAGAGAVVVLSAVGLLIAAVSSDDKAAETLSVEIAESPAPLIPQPEKNHELTIQQATEDLIQGLLAQAKLDVAENRILEPDNNNAVFRYKKILALQEDQPEALQGLSALIEHYQSLINATIDEQSWQQAKQQIEELKLITNDAQVINPLLARTKDYEKRLQKIAKTLDQADSYFKQNRLIRPDPANALFLYTKVLELDPDNRRANDGVNKIVAKLSEVMREQIRTGRISSAEQTYVRIEAIDPNAPVLKEAGANFAAIVDRKKSIGGLLKSAERDFIRGNLTKPAGNNAYTKYREVLRINPQHKDAQDGIDRVYAYYVSSYYQYLQDARFDKAEEIVNTLREIDYGKKQIVILRRMVEEEKLAAKNEPETIRLMLSQLEKGLKNKDISTVANLSVFEKKNRQFFEKLFKEYSAYSVSVKKTEHDLKSHSAKASVNFSNLVVGNEAAKQADKKDIRIDVLVSRNEDKQWKITW
ncbi:MAG TPA: serine/threonine-protein kinase [Gammaproteobacteria bacterium]